MAMIHCKECGKEINNNTNFCIHCGSSIGTSNETNLKVIYSKDPRPMVPKIQVTINGSHIAELVNGEETDLTVKESGTLLFKGSFRKTKVEFNKDNNYTIILSWNVLTGKLVADVEKR